jgi:hypothetical protein
MEYRKGQFSAKYLRSEDKEENITFKGENGK